MWTYEYASLGNWLVTDGIKEFVTNSEEDAKWLVKILNEE